MRISGPLNWAERARREFNPGMALVLVALACLLWVAWVRWSSPPAPEAVIVPEQVRVLRFIDQTDGSINVIDTASEELVQHFSGEQGFLRGTLRALVRERKLRGIDAGAEKAFELIAHSSGRLTLRDPATGFSIALESFGHTNTAVFGQLLR